MRDVTRDALEKSSFCFDLQLSYCSGFSNRLRTADENSLEEAQSCLNNAATTAVTNAAAGSQAAYGCEATIANMTGPEAGQIGVGLVLIEEQKLTNLTSVENAISNGSGAIATSITYLTLSSVAQVNKLVNYATISGSSSCQELADIINFAQFLNAQTGGTINPSTTTGAITSAIAGIIATNNATLIASTANAAASAQISACSGSGSSSTLCTDLTKAIGGASNPTTILQNISSYITSGG
ncbi:unnamed protein product [Sphagnum balticum]